MPFEDPPALVALGKYYLLENQLDEEEAEKLFTMAAKSKNYANGHHHLGLLCRKRGDEAEAISCFHLATSLGSGSACCELYQHFKPTLLESLIWFNLG